MSEMDCNYVRYGLRETLSQMRACATVEEAVALMERSVAEFEMMFEQSNAAMDYCAKWTARYARLLSNGQPTRVLALRAAMAVWSRLIERRREDDVCALTDYAHDLEEGWPDDMWVRLRSDAAELAVTLVADHALDLLNAGDV
jgi:hypothetical protein